MALASLYREWVLMRNLLMFTKFSQKILTATLKKLSAKCLLKFEREHYNKQTNWIVDHAIKLRIRIPSENSAFVDLLRIFV